MANNPPKVNDWLPDNHPIIKQSIAAPTKENTVIVLFMKMLLTASSQGGTPTNVLHVISISLEIVW